MSNAIHPACYEFPGAHVPVAPCNSYRFQVIIAQVAKSEAAVSLLRDLALGTQAERPLTASRIPVWATTFVEVA